MALVVAKLFLVDLFSMETVERIVSFLGVGPAADAGARVLLSASAVGTGSLIRVR